METSEIAAKALEILDRDGWCRGTFTQLRSVPPAGMWGDPGDWVHAGPHCGGGIWSLACGYETWAAEEFFVPVWEKICELFPEDAAAAKDFFKDSLSGDAVFVHTALARTVRWNDHFASEADVRLVFEKLAAG